MNLYIFTVELLRPMQKQNLLIYKTFFFQFLIFHYSSVKGNVVLSFTQLMKHNLAKYQKTETDEKVQ